LQWRETARNGRRSATVLEASYHNLLVIRISPGTGGISFSQLLISDRRLNISAVSHSASHGLICQHAMPWSGRIIPSTNCRAVCPGAVFNPFSEF
jgi:hypothetical protein